MLKADVLADGQILAGLTGNMDSTPALLHTSATPTRHKCFNEALDTKPNDHSHCHTRLDIKDGI